MEIKHSNQITQVFRDDEILFRRVHIDNITTQGKATFSAFELPDMSVNRSKFSDANEARKGFILESWGVSEFSVGDLPPRDSIPQEEHYYKFITRHIPVIGNFAHSEIRVWRIDGGISKLLTTRTRDKFEKNDPDIDSILASFDQISMVFYAKWRRKLAFRAKMCLLPEKT